MYDIIMVRKWFAGYVHLEMTGNRAERFFNMCSYHRIALWDIKADAKKYSFFMTKKDLKRAEKILEKTGQNIRLERQYGFPMLLDLLRENWSFFAGILFCLFMIVLFSTHIWEVTFDGNHYYTEDVLMDYFKKHNVHAGVPKSGINCEQLAADIRNDYPDIIWVSVSIKGTFLQVQIKENQNLQAQIQPPMTLDDQKELAYDLVAEQGGIIQHMVTATGIPLVAEGDTVEKGQVLVSGTIPIMNDEQEEVAFRYCIPKAEIVVRFEEPYEDVLSKVYSQKIYAGNNLCRLTVRTHHLAFYIPLSNQLHFLGKGNREIHTRCKSPQINSSFLAPFQITFQTEKTYQYRTKNYTKKELQERLSASFEVHCDNLREKGVEIAENNVKIYVMSDSAKAAGTLILLKKIGELNEYHRDDH